MFWLKKAITFCLMPFTASIGLIILGVLLSYRKQWPRLGRTLIVAGALLLLVTSHRQVGLLLLRPLEQQYPAIPELSAGDAVPANLAVCQYIVVLGGGHADVALLPATSKLSPYALARIVEGVRLARLLPEAKIITTGPGYSGLPTHAEILGHAATALGVDPHRLINTDTARDTENEALALYEIIGDRPFALVTSAWHMPRAISLMRKAGLHPLACPVDFHAKGNDRFAWSDWLWGLDGLENSTWAIYERLGYWWASVRGRIDG